MGIAPTGGSIARQCRDSRRLAAVSAIAVLLVFAVVGCGGTGKAPYEPGRQAVAHVEVGAWNPGETLAPSQGWPWPGSDIPAVPGTLDPSSYRTGRIGVGNGGTGGCTLRFTGVSYKQFQAYAMQLKASGYQLDGLVYYNSDEAKAKARGQAGDVDQLVAVKGSRSLTIWSPAQTGGVLRVDVQGLTQVELDAIPAQNLGSLVGVGPNGETYALSMPPIPSRASHAVPTMPQLPSTVAQGSGPADWPAEWAADVPEPQGCVIDPEAVTAISGNSLYVVCVFSGSDSAGHQAFIKAYVALLIGAGYTKENEQSSDSGELLLVSLRKGSVTVVISDTEPTGMTVVASRH